MSDNNIAVLTKRNDLSWHYRASCLGMDTELFYFEPNLKGQSKRDKARIAKTICADCPVKLQCLIDAVTRDDRHSIQGGTTPEERGSLHESIACWPLEKVLLHLQRKEKVNA